MFDDELREFWNWPKDDQQIKLGKPYAQENSTEIIGASRLVMLLDANGRPNVLAHTDENNAMETSTTLNVALWKRVVFHGQLWLVCLIFFWDMPLSLFRCKDVIAYLTESTKSHRVNRVTSTLAGDAQVQIAWCQHHHVNFTLLMVLIIPRQLGWLKKTGVPYPIRKLDNPTTKCGGLIVTYEQLVSPNQWPLQIHFGKVQIGSTPTKYQWQIKGLRGDSPGGDCYWMGEPDPTYPTDFSA